MTQQDVIAATITAGLGLVLIASAALDAEWLMSLPKTRMVADRFGRPGARMAIVLLGAVLLALAGVIASGWRMDWS